MTPAQAEMLDAVNDDFQAFLDLVRCGVTPCDFGKMLAIWSDRGDGRCFTAG